MAGEPSVRGQADQSPPGARHARLLGYARHGHCRQPLCAGTRRRIPALCVHPGPRPAHSGTPVMKIEALRNPNMAFVGPIAGGGLLIAAAVLLMPSHWQIADAIRRATFAPPPVAMPLPPPGPAILLPRLAPGKTLSISAERRVGKEVVRPGRSR